MFNVVTISGLTSKKSNTHARDRHYFPDGEKKHSAMTVAQKEDFTAWRHPQLNRAFMRLFEGYLFKRKTVFIVQQIENSYLSPTRL
jgi:hypothetical protein